jgi:hypothetical protein
MDARMGRQRSSTAGGVSAIAFLTAHPSRISDDLQVVVLSKLISRNH